jgi:hypothetical protein
MPTATELGITEKSKTVFPQQMSVGMVLEVNEMPEFIPATKDYAYDQVVLSTVSDGKFYTTSGISIGALKSATPKSTGDALRKAIEQNQSLTIFVNDYFNETTGNHGISVGLYPTKKRQ